MRKLLLSAIAVLAVAGAANALIISAPTGVDGGASPAGIADLAIPISVSGGELFKGAIVSIVIQDGVITGLDRKAGTIMSGSANVVDPPAIYDPAGGAKQVAVFSDFSMGFTDAAVPASGVLAVLHVSTVGLAAGTYSILLQDDVNGLVTGLTDANASAIAGGLVAGSFVVTPEPVSLALLGLGALFIRRRR